MKINHKHICLLSGIIFLFGLIFCWGLLPLIMNSVLKTQVWLKPGSRMREMWSKTPFALRFLIHPFNITNPEDVLMGKPPILQELGPYYFDEWKEKYDEIDNEEEDSITFNLRNTYIFRPDKSNGLTGNEILVMPNVLLQSIVLVVKRKRTKMLNFVKKAVDIVFANQTSLITGTFKDIFFDGIFVDCSSNEFSAQALCTQFHTGDIQGSRVFNETHFLFSLFGEKNATNAGKLTVLRGIKDVKKLGKLIKFDDEKEMAVWGEGECNKFIGTDSTIFPPGIDPVEGIWAFTPDLCRSLGSIYQGQSSHNGLPASRFIADLGDLKSKDSLHCFCPDNNPSLCPVKGTMDLEPCMGGPITASMPHFYNGDVTLFTNVKGLKPVEEKHAVILDFETISGTPLKAAKRIQFNLDVEPIQEIEFMRNVTKMQFPLFWVEEGMELNRTFTNMLKGLKANMILKWIFMVVSSIGMAYASFLHIKHIYEDSSKSPKIQAVIAEHIEISEQAAQNMQREQNTESK